ncbi:MAG: YdcF family protein, partial [Acetobacteraceae bacterium]
GGAVEQNLTEARGIPALNGAAERMTEPVALLRRHPEAKLVFTGGQGSLVHGGVTEADVAATLWRDLGVTADRVVLEREARNTWENAVLTHRLVQPKPGETWLLVTSASHMPRAMGVFRQAGWEIIPWPVNYRTGNTAAARLDASFPERLREFEWGVREWVGLVSYWLMGRTPAPFPAP